MSKLEGLSPPCRSGRGAVQAGSPHHKSVVLIRSSYRLCPIVVRPSWLHISTVEPAGRKARISIRLRNPDPCGFSEFRISRFGLVGWGAPYC